MEVDYSQFLLVGADGKIWWQLTDAVKLGAGYLPVKDEDRDLEPVLRAKSNRVRANERSLLSEFSQDHYGESHPRVLRRDGIRFVEAHEFMGWLSQFVAQTQSEINFPDALASALRSASKRPGTARTAGSSFQSLTRGLQEWFDRPLAVPAPTAGDLALRETRVAALRREIDAMNGRERQARGDYYPVPPEQAAAAAEKPGWPPSSSARSSSADRGANRWEA